MVICPICKKKFKSLVSHVTKGHKITSKEFKKLYPKIDLYPKELKKMVSKTCKQSGCGKWKGGRTLSKEHKKKISNAVSGNKNPFYGKKHTKQTKQKMSENHADFGGNNNPFKKWIENKDNRKRWLQSINKYHKSIRNNPELNKKRRERLSKTAANAHINGKLYGYGRGHKNGYFYSKKQNLKIYYRSSYELKFLEWCEKNDEIKQFVPCDFFIKYEFNGMTKRYIPDFIINKLIVVEIKPKTLINTKQNKAKFLFGNRYCEQNKMKYSIIVELDLEDLDKWMKNI